MKNFVKMTLATIVGLIVFSIVAFFFSFAIIGAMVCVCLLVLGRIVSKMNISSALKLGED